MARSQRGTCNEDIRSRFEQPHPVEPYAESNKRCPCNCSEYLRRPNQSPEPWLDKLLSQALRVEGVSLMWTLPDYEQAPSADVIRQSIEAFVAECRAKRPFSYPSSLPVSIVALACIKNRSPLPMELWRQSIWPEAKTTPPADEPAK
jgi:hypothetical protein